MAFWETIGIAFLPTIITSVISFLGSILKIKKDLQKIELEFDKQLQFYNDHSIYDIKKEAILSSLNLLDKYLSWLEYESKIIPIRENSDTKYTLTFEARRCFNNLCVTCNNNELITLFIKIIFSGKSELSWYQKYRNVARKELGLNEIDIDREHVFLSRITTEDLEINL